MNWVELGINIYEIIDVLVDIFFSFIFCFNSFFFNSVCFVVKFVLLEKSNYLVIFLLFFRCFVVEFMMNKRKNVYIIY